MLYLIGGLQQQPRGILLVRLALAHQLVMLAHLAHPIERR
jgi:hypothetical protein